MDYRQFIVEEIEESGNGDERDDDDDEEVKKMKGAVFCVNIEYRAVRGEETSHREKKESCNIDVISQM